MAYLSLPKKVVELVFSHSKVCRTPSRRTLDPQEATAILRVRMPVRRRPRSQSVQGHVDFTGAERNVVLISGHCPLELPQHRSPTRVAIAAGQQRRARWHARVASCCAYSPVWGSTRTPQRRTYGQVRQVLVWRDGLASFAPAFPAITRLQYCAFLDHGASFA